MSSQIGRISASERIPNYSLLRFECAAINRDKQPIQNLQSRNPVGGGTHQFITVAYKRTRVPIPIVLNSIRTALPAQDVPTIRCRKHGAACGSDSGIGTRRPTGFNSTATRYTASASFLANNDDRNQVALSVFIIRPTESVITFSIRPPRLVRSKLRPDEGHFPVNLVFRHIA